MDDWERIVALGTPGIFESNYLKANSPDGQRALWIKHNLMRPVGGEGFAELTVVLFERGTAAIVGRRDVPWSQVEASSERVSLHAGGVSLEPGTASGRIADISWSLALSGGNRPLHFLPHAWMYTGPFPKKKGLTPQPNLHFHGEVRCGPRRWAVEDWVGLRGHNWGREHALAYAYGNCNLWDDGDRERTVDGISARIRLAGRTTPWLTVLAGQAPEVGRSTLRNWLGAATVAPTRWRLAYTQPWRRRPLALDMQADPETFVGLRYAHPDGRESYCYNTKFADVRYTIDGQTHTSRCGELEVLFAEPLAGVALHPSAGWGQADGDYRSA